MFAVYHTVLHALQLMGCNAPNALLTMFLRQIGHAPVLCKIVLSASLTELLLAYSALLATSCQRTGVRVAAG